eukprot:TRINITY_DN19409_c0_g1_i4.p1 TRINITY_DN19409_c0_g1~~TRINITY_DN19409_c0_g1_i4.p1  ORF type:complete len:903 (+),score=286.51 TRINITY_DN19409_c0_g1_i4:38-2746(+)
MPTTSYGSVKSPPGSPRGGRLSIDTLRKLERLGERAFARGDYDEATTHTTKCIKALQAELASLLSLRAAINLQQKEFANASADAENAIQLNKGWYKGYLRKGAILLAMNEPMEAAEQLETALQLTPNNAEVKRTLREAYKAISNNCYESGYYEFAMRWCDHAMEILKSENDLSEEEFAQQMALCSSSRSAANMRQGNIREALRDAELAVFYNPWWVKGWLRKGTALAQLGTPGDLDAAIDSVEEGLMMDLKSTEAKQTLDTIRSKIESGSDRTPFDTSYSLMIPPQADDTLPEDVPPFHEEWARYQADREGFSMETIEIGIKVLYDSYLQARNIKLHLFSLETYEWSDEEDAIYHRVGCSERGLEWFKSKPPLGDVRDCNPDTDIKPSAIIRNRSFLHYPPMKLTIQVHRQVSMVMFHFTDLMVPLLSTIVYADSASVLEIIGYESNTYAVAKAAVLLEMLMSGAPLECIIQVWMSSGWSHVTEAAFKQACLKLAKTTASPASLSHIEQRDQLESSIPYEAKVIIQIWSGVESIPRQTSLTKWREAHSRQDLGFLAANLKHCQDRVDYCQYFLTGELLQCDVGSIAMFADFSKVQTMTTSESIMQAIPLMHLQVAHHKDGTLLQTVVDVFKRRLHVMRLRLKKRRLKMKFYLTPVMSLSALNEPQVMQMLDQVKRHKAAHYYWGLLPDKLGATGMMQLIELCGAKHCKNYAQSLQWNNYTYGAHLLDYSRETRSDLIESLWREAQHGIKAVGSSFMVDRPFAHPFHLCAWGLGKKYMRAWAQQFFLSCPDVTIHDVSCAEFSSFSLFPLAIAWTPEPLKQALPGVVRCASPVAALQGTDLGDSSVKHTHATTIQCHTCDQVVKLEEAAAPDQKFSASATLGAERLDVMVNVLDGGSEYSVGN